MLYVAETVLLRMERGALMAIPDRLLIHTCTYATPSAYDRDGNKTLGEETTLSGVRIEPVDATTISTEGENKDDKLTMFVPYSSDVTPEPLGVVTWNGSTYTVRSVTACYTHSSDTIHHWECALV